MLQWTMPLAATLIGLCLSAGAQALDLQAMLHDAVAQQAKELVIPPGEYRIAPVSEGRPHLTLSGAKDLTIIATGVRLVCTSLDRALEIDHCSNLKFVGLTVDYDPLPFTQGTIVAVADDGTWLDVRIDPGYRMIDGAARGVVYDAATRTIKPTTWARFGAKAIPQDDGLLRLQSPRGIKDATAVGDLLVVLGPTRSPHAIMLTSCSGTIFEDVTVHASTTFGILERSCDASVYRRCRITPGPPPLPEAPARLLSTNADAIHSKHARVGPTIEDCLIERMNDDGIAINGDYALVVRAPEPGVVWLAGKYDLPFEAGDRLLVRAKGKRSLTDAKIVAVAPVAVPEGVDPTQVALQHLPGLYQAQHLFKKWYEIRLESATPMNEGDIVSSPDRTGNGFVVRRNTIRDHRARGILIKASDGVIEGNTINGSSIAGISLCPEPDHWMEADFSRGVKIIGNTVRRCGYSHPNPNTILAGGINVCAEHRDVATGHRDIIIAGNTLDAIVGTSLLITSARDVTVKDNRIINPQTTAANGSGSNLGVDPSHVVWIDHVQGLTLEGNTVATPADTKLLGKGDAVESLRGEKTGLRRTR